MRNWILAIVAMLALLAGWALVMAATASLSWEAPTLNADGTQLTDLASYKIYRDDNNNGTFSLLAGVAVPTQTYSDTTLTDGVFCYYVTAVDETGNESLPSNIACKTIDTILPGSPANLQVN